MEATTRQFLKGLPTQAPVKITQSPHSTVPDCGIPSHVLRISSLENVVEKLTATINEMVAKADADQRRNETGWHGTQQSEDRLWGTIHRMERDSNSQDRTIQKLERSAHFNEQRSVAHQGQLNELKSTVRSQEQQLAAQCTEIRQLRGSVRGPKHVQISQQHESDRLRQRVDREVHPAASHPEEGLEGEPPSCLDRSHNLSKHNETGSPLEGEYASLVEEAARRSRERRALQEEIRRDFHQKAQSPIATSSPARKATEPVAELSLNMKVLGDSVKQLVDLQHKTSQGVSSPRTYLGVHQLLPLIESFAKNESTEKREGLEYLEGGP
ncbi:MAG: hypothetical protein GY782_09890, partial [Gammaproteobacteria bacterium]|nr:hypothetical protein [Gammaproteobacteria bacterium]